ncbi:hypothetical protein evm_010143 [Chilo suppressalis]|nr:hypothetical protein evm_010143 [Chilo suppressalis]
MYNTLHLLITTREDSAAPGGVWGVCIGDAGMVTVLLVLTAASAWFVIRKRPFGKGVVGLGSLASSQSVSFRQGSNVEFGGVPEPAYTLEEAPRKGRDFSNPMYDAVTQPATPADPLPGIYEVPSEAKDKVVSAVISPSSTETRSARAPPAPAPRGFHSHPHPPRALDPAADTGSDTQGLVNEDRA